MAREIKIALALLATIAVLSVGFAVVGGPQLLVFRPLEGAADLLQRLTPLLVIALFVERALEVFVTAWRAPQQRMMKAMRNTTLGKLTPEENAGLIQYKSDTQRVAFVSGIVFGIVVSAIGVRALALFISPEEIAGFTGWQRPLFTAVDVLVTGAVIGGGADGIHKIVNLFTTFFDTTTAQVESRRPPASPQG
jgi:hypothetical protein